MWLLPRLRLPFSTPAGFLRWFVTGINFWAVGAVVLCAFAGWFLLERFGQPRQLGVEQALAGGEGTQGLTYTVERTGEEEATVTGTWDGETDPEPDPELAAALCAALSPEAIYGHSDHLYRAIASRFFEGEDFTLTILLRRTATKEEQKEDTEPEPLFSVTRPAGADDWTQPDCAAAFARDWRESYDQYWLFGQGRKEEMGPPQSDPIFEEGDLPPEPGGEQDGEEAPPLPDLDGGSSGAEGGPPQGEETSSSQAEEEPSSSSSSSGGGEDGDAPGGWLERLLAYASRYRGLSWEEAWELFREGNEREGSQ